jgi:DNA-binding IclR family transcriptional regulator
MDLNKSASRTIEILRLISSSKSPPSLSQISQSLRIPKASTFDILQTLLKLGVVEPSEKDAKSFRLGLTLFEIVLPALSSTNTLKVARPFLEELRSMTGETIFLAVENNGQLVFLDKVEGASMMRATVDLGARSLMHSSAIGKALLATYSSKKLEQIFKNHSLVKYTPNTIDNMSDLIKDIEAIRKRGFAIDLQEKYQNVVCVGAPVFSAASKSIAGISIAFQATNTDQKKLHHFGKILESFALRISKKLGYTKEGLFC